MFGVALAVAAGAVASADPKPSAVDIKAIKDKLIVLSDAQSNVYVAYWDGDKATTTPRLFFGSSKTKQLYEQIIIGKSTNESAWDIDTWAPRLKDMHPGALRYLADGTYQRYCSGQDDAGLTQLTGDKAKAVVDGYTFLTSALVHRPHLLARDDSGVYYYIDKVAAAYGGNGYRVFVGKRGAMKQLPLVDVATDGGGQVFSTKLGDLRLVSDTSSSDGSGKLRVSFVKGDKRTELVWLDLDVNSPLIFKDLGVYDFIGTLCDNV
jgi:hypothetical protein